MKLEFTKDLSNKKLHVIRQFQAPKEMVWKAWTTAELLDQWWAPRPYQTITKTLDFKEGGFWLYHMLSPEGDKHWCRLDYLTIVPQDYYTAIDAFCDEEGTPNSDIPQMTWRNTFTEKGSETIVTVQISFEKEEDIQKIIDLGFKEGFTAALENLDQYIEQQFKLRGELKTSTAPRVTTYLNFPGTTEEAFTRYKTIFRSEFSGRGIQRFGDLPSSEEQPPIAEGVKNMILHIELPITGGHLLMASDAPEEMGFTVNQGDNVHICLEPETREETQRLFDELSQDGKITMPLQDMFFGAFFGTCKDKFGINWMFSHR